jgi:hypothetical protein
MHASILYLFFHGLREHPANLVYLLRKKKQKSQLHKWTQVSKSRQHASIYLADASIYLADSLHK